MLVIDILIDVLRFTLPTKSVINWSLNTSTYPNRIKSSQIKRSKNLNSLKPWGFSLNPRARHGNPRKLRENRPAKNLQHPAQCGSESLPQMFQWLAFLVSLWKCHPVNHGTGLSTHSFWCTDVWTSDVGQKYKRVSMNRNITMLHDWRNDVLLHDEFLAFALWVQRSQT